MNLWSSTLIAHLQKQNSYDELSTDSTISRIFYSASYVYDISFGRFVNSYVVEHRAIPCPRSGHGYRFNECGRYRGSLN
jgi:hypothetical protein